MIAELIKDEVVALQIRDESQLQHINSETPLSTTGVSALDPTAVDGTDLLGREDMSIPRLELVQAQSDMPDADQHLGQWYNTLTGEFKRNVNAVLLSLGMGRAAFPRDFSRDSEPLCASDNAIEPRYEYVGKIIDDPKLGIESDIPPTCAECPFSKFGEKGETPLCAKSYAYFMIDVESGLPFVVRMQRSATKAAKQINTISKMRGRRNLIVLSSKKVNSDNGNYYEPIFSSGDVTPSDVLALAAQLSADFGNMASRAVQRETNGNGGNRHSDSPTPLSTTEFDAPPPPEELTEAELPF